MMKKLPLPRLLKELFVILLGSAIYALCFNWCYQPNHLSMGGFTGIAQIIHRLLPAVPVGITVILLNIPLFYLAGRRLGIKLLIGSLFAMVSGSLMIDTLDMAVSFSEMDPLLACIYGGVLLGLSMGLLLSVGATTGGTELAARLLKLKLRHLSIGKLCMSIDLVVILLYAFTFNNLHNALYGVVALYISSVTMDAVVYGSSTAKMAYIISDKGSDLAGMLLKMDLGVTILKGQGAWSGNDKQVILCAFKRNQVAAVKSAVTELDPNAFIIVCEAHEILGERFGVYSPDSL